MKNKICLECEKEFSVVGKRKDAKYCSRECYEKNWTGYLYGVRIKKGEHFNRATEFKKGRNGDRNEKHPQWKGDDVGYGGIHNWLRINFGNPDVCENVDCLKKPTKRFEWALIKGKKCERKRENFIKMCVSCHRRYDMTEDKRQNMIKSQIKRWKTKKLNEKNLGCKQL
jgi:hypothetical protein